jgi:hypothetical protein
MSEDVPSGHQSVVLLLPPPPSTCWLVPLTYCTLDEHHGAGMEAVLLLAGCFLPSLIRQSVPLFLVYSSHLQMKLLKRMNRLGKPMQHSLEASKQICFLAWETASAVCLPAFVLALLRGSMQPALLTGRALLSMHAAPSPTLRVSS